MRTGDLRVIAGLARDLMRWEREHPLSAAEKDQLKLACRPVLAELALSLTLSDEAVEDLVERTVVGRREASALVGAPS